MGLKFREWIGVEARANPDLREILGRMVWVGGGGGSAKRSPKHSPPSLCFGVVLLGLLLW